MNPASELMAIVVRLNADEVAVLLEIARRLRGGRNQYGALDLGNDQRDFRREAVEEFLDAAVYLACETLQRSTDQAEIDPPPE